MIIGQSFLIDNKPGAATILGVQAQMAAPAGGYPAFPGNDSLANNLCLLDARQVSVQGRRLFLHLSDQQVATCPRYVTGFPG
jgi:hypothetical protein